MSMTLLSKVGQMFHREPTPLAKLQGEIQAADTALGLATRDVGPALHLVDEMAQGKGVTGEQVYQALNKLQETDTTLARKLTDGTFDKVKAPLQNRIALGHKGVQDLSAVFGKLHEAFKPSAANGSVDGVLQLHHVAGARPFGFASEEIVTQAAAGAQTVRHDLKGVFDLVRGTAQHTPAKG
jgi:hypothetical protein